MTDLTPEEREAMEEPRKPIVLQEGLVFETVHMGPDMTVRWIIRNLKTDEIFCFATHAAATDYAIQQNRADEDNPAFHLFEIGEGCSAQYRGRLWRDFGDDELYWNKTKQ